VDNPVVPTWDDFGLVTPFDATYPTVVDEDRVQSSGASYSYIAPTYPAQTLGNGSGVQATHHAVISYTLDNTAGNNVMFTAGAELANVDQFLVALDCGFGARANPVTGSGGGALPGGDLVAAGYFTATGSNANHTGNFRIIQANPLNGQLVLQYDATGGETANFGYIDYSYPGANSFEVNGCEIGTPISFRIYFDQTDNVSTISVTDKTTWDYGYPSLPLGNLTCSPAPWRMFFDVTGHANQEAAFPGSERLWGGFPAGGYTNASTNLNGLVGFDIDNGSGDDLRTSGEFTLDGATADANQSQVVVDIFPVGDINNPVGLGPEDLGWFALNSDELTIVARDLFGNPIQQVDSDASAPGTETISLDFNAPIVGNVIVTMPKSSNEPDSDRSEWDGKPR
jgi:hypothetical protein